MGRDAPLRRAEAAVLHEDDGTVPDGHRRELRDIYRCLEPSGRLLMLEHVRGRIGPMAIAQDLVTPLTRRSGPDMNRDSRRHVVDAGFRVLHEENVYLDIGKAVEATRADAPAAGSVRHRTPADTPP